MWQKEAAFCFSEMQASRQAYCLNFGRVLWIEAVIIIRRLSEEARSERERSLNRLTQAVLSPNHVL